MARYDGYIRYEMILTNKLVTELKRRLKIGSHRGVHLNAIPGRSRYKFDISGLSYIDKRLPDNFINALLSDLPLKFRISWKNNVPDLNSLFQEEQTQLVRITKAFENLINQTEVIESEKGLNTFGFGFPIIARRDKADDKLTVAPILIWNLRIKGTTEFNTWEITRKEDDPIYVNEVLINHLLLDSGITIESISSDMLDKGLINKNELIEICSKIIKCVNTDVLGNIESIYNEQLEKIVPIGDKKYYENLPLSYTKAIIEFGGLFSIFEAQKENIIKDYDDLTGLDLPLGDLENNDFQTISSIETDPSQQEILDAITRKRNILIQGPPGTGKSQTLTAILINALENKKRVLVVCEKRAALEVLHNAMVNNGLGIHCALIKNVIEDRRSIVESVRERVENGYYGIQRSSFTHVHLTPIIKRIKTLIDEINEKHQKIGRKLIGDKCHTDVVGELLKEMSSFDDKVDLNLDRNIFNFSESELGSLMRQVKKGQSLYHDYVEMESKTFINPQKLVKNKPYEIEEAIKRDFNSYSKIITKIRTLIKSAEEKYLASRENEFNQQVDEIKRISSDIESIIEVHEQNQDFANEDKINKFTYKLFSIFSKTKRKILSDYSSLQNSFKSLEEFLNSSKDIKPLIFAGKLENKKECLSQLLENINLIKNDFSIKVRQEFENIDLLNVDSQVIPIKDLSTIQKDATFLINKVREDDWLKVPLNYRDLFSLLSGLESYLKTENEYFNAGKDLFLTEFRWYQFYNGLSDLEKKVVNALKLRKDWAKDFLIYYLNSVLLMSTELDLVVNEEDYNSLKSDLSEFGKVQINSIKKLWEAKQFLEIQNFQEKNLGLSIENLYNKKGGSRFKRHSLREIVLKDINLFTTFFPVILTSPDIASNLFKGKVGYFDIVMFDEASQLRLEDNFPAILKGKQIVIAGDEHQMPPSNYFSKVFDASVEDEDEIEEQEDSQTNFDNDDSLLSCESLLDFGASLSFKKEFLDFHYRSRHPLLIDFSNFAFYKQRLKPLPNRFNYVPIKYIQVNGTFSDHTNELEAEMVLSIIDKNINRLPDGKYPSLGVATFNIMQRDLIKNKINERRKFAKYKSFNDKIQELEREGMFVKNLENIQGDERDVIILSTTYGIDKDGKFNQRFGPINLSKGYRLLNVIITRAKYKIYCCTSVPEKVFLNYREYLTIERSNNRKAVFYAYLAYCKAVSDCDESSRKAVLNELAKNATTSVAIAPEQFSELESPFEEEVYQCLADHFGEENLIPQFQFAGFRIDIVYNPSNPNSPKVAVECDGAKYHSSQEAYLHDHYRQKILEGYGFVFHRIWSTNWWRNPKREIQKLINFIEEIEKQARPQSKEYSGMAKGFTDEIVMPEKYYQRSLFHDFNSDSQTLPTTRDVQLNLLRSKLDDRIKVNSKVSVKYINNGKDMQVQIVSSENNQHIASNGIQKINEKSALAVSLLGHLKGDVVKVGNLDNFVEIMKIEN